MSAAMPNLFIIGAPRSATSSLAAALGEHPDIGLATLKEPHYFSWCAASQPPWAVRTLDAYLSLFSQCAHKRFRIDASTWYLFCPAVAQHIRQASPDARVLVVLRHPVDRAYSAWCFNRANGWETELSFERALERERDPSRTDRSWDKQYMSAGHYGRQLQAWFEDFPRERVRVISFEHLVSHANATMAEVVEWLGLPAGDCTEGWFRKSNEAREVRFGSALPSGIRSVWRFVIPRQIRAKAHGYLRPVFDWMMFRRPARLDAQHRLRLVESIRDDIELLSQLTGVDFARDWLSPKQSALGDAASRKSHGG